tara:strand:+ start:394 stop:576 length:183 start_codon:yes stop_codon:yes gene_type:complete
MLSSNQREQLRQFMGFIDKMENEGSSQMFRDLYGCGNNEAKILSVAPFMVNIIAQILEDV